MKILLVLLVLALVLVNCRAFLFSSGCSKDADCGTDGCCTRSFLGGRCGHRLALSHRCPLTVTTQTSCMNLCATGLACVDQSNLDLAVEPGVNTQGVGRCMHPSTGGVTGAPATATAPSA